MPTPSLDAVAAFAAVVRRGSFRAAAPERGVSPSALSHTITKLERDLGVRLLHRSPRALTLTEAGERLMAAAGPSLHEIGEALVGLDSLRDAPTGRIRLTAPRFAALTVLSEALPSFLSRYPEIEVDIRVADRFEDLATEGRDAGIRLGEALQPDMVAVPISGPIAMAVVASPAYIRVAPPIREPEDIKAHQCIGLRLKSTDDLYRWEFERAGRTLSVAVRSRLSLDDQELILAAAASGLGLAYTTFDYAAPHLADGRLVRVLDEWTPPDERLFLYYPSRTNQPSALRALVHHLRQRSAAPGP